MVFCSLDKTPETFADYSKDMPWWCLSFQSSIVGTLANLYAGGELAIPLLVVIDANGIVLGTDGVGQVTVDPSGARFPWRPARIVDLLPDQYLMKDDDANNNNGIAVTTYSVADLNDKFLMLYFSAHWCPPCKKFTPKLSAAYLELKKVRSDFEVSHCNVCVCVAV